MPNLSLTLPETTQSILRPIVIDLVKQIQEITKISNTTEILFPGDIGKAITAGSDINSETNRDAKFSSTRRTYIEVEENYNLDAINSTAVTYNEHIPVFIDEKLRVKIAPVYASTDLVINFKHRCTSKTEAFKWRDDIRMRVSQMRDINLHSITYHYALPLELLIILQTIYEKRESNLGYGQTFPEYITTHSSDRLTLIGDLVNQDARLAISETQTRIIGIFGFDAIPEKPERDDANGTWSVEFSYKLSYEKPIACNMRYPVIVHNQLLPAPYTFFTDKSYDLDKVRKTFTKSLHALNSFESDTTMNARVNPNAIIRLPEFDDYNIPSVPIGTGTVFLALSQVEEDKRTLLNLNELGDIVLDKDILDFIRNGEYRYIGNLYKSMIHVSLYRNEHLTTSGSLICDENLNIKAIADLDLRDQYRVRLSVVIDLTLLKKEIIDRIKTTPKALVKIVGSMNEILRDHVDFVNLGDKTSISNNEFDTIYRILTGYGYDNGHGMTRDQYFGEGRNIQNWPYRGVSSFSQGGNLSSQQTTINQNNQIQNSNPDYNGAIPYQPGALTPRANPLSSNYKYSSNNFLADLDPRVVENYRRNRINMNSTQVLGIVAIHKER